MITQENSLRGGVVAQGDPSKEEKMEEDIIPEGYVRVTEVLSPYTPFVNLDPDTSFARNVSNAADRGKRVHKYCEAHALGLFVEECAPECKNYVESFKKWFDEMVFHVESTEQRVNSEEYRLSGCVDLVCRIKGDDGLTLIDIKTPASASKTWQLQTAAYQLLLGTVCSVHISRRICLMVSKDGGKPHLVEYTEHESDATKFMHALGLHHFFRR